MIFITDTLFRSWELVNRFLSHTETWLDLVQEFLSVPVVA